MGWLRRSVSIRPKMRQQAIDPHDTGMQRYFFDVVSSTRSMYDYTGREFPTIQNAMDLADLIAVDLGTEQEWLGCAVAICTTTGERLDFVPLTESELFAGLTGDGLILHELIKMNRPHRTGSWQGLIYTTAGVRGWGAWRRQLFATVLLIRKQVPPPTNLKNGRLHVRAAGAGLTAEEFKYCCVATAWPTGVGKTAVSAIRQSCKGGRDHVADPARNQRRRVWSGGCSRRRASMRARRSRCPTGRRCTKNSSVAA